MRNFDEFIKTAATYRDIMKPQYYRVRGSYDNYDDDEINVHYADGARVKTKIRPHIAPDGSYGYKTTTSGKTELTKLFAMEEHPDVVGEHYQRGDKKAYDDYMTRMKPYIDKYKKANMFTRGHYGRKVVKKLSDKDRDLLMSFKDFAARGYSLEPCLARNLDIMTPLGRQAMIRNDLPVTRPGSVAD